MTDIETSFSHDTHWFLEKRNGGIDEFVSDRIDEAKAVIAGKRPWNTFTGKSRDALMDFNDQLIAWRGNLTGSDLAALTQDKIIDGAVRKLFHHQVPAYEIVEREGNILVTAGITVLLTLLTGGASTAFSNANAHLGVGTSSSATTVAQTDLQATLDKFRAQMNVDYPKISAPTIQFQSTFTSAQANFQWQELGTFNASTSGTMLNRVVQDLGVKSNGSTWSLTETISWS